MFGTYQFVPQFAVHRGHAIWIGVRLEDALWWAIHGPRAKIGLSQVERIGTMRISTVQCISIADNLWEDNGARDGVVKRLDFE